MIKTVEELKELIEWAKKTRVKTFKVGEIEVHLSDYAFIEGLNEPSEPSVVSAPDVSAPTKTPDWTAGSAAEDNKADDEDLFWSTR